MNTRKLVARKVVVFVVTTMEDGDMAIANRTATWVVAIRVNQRNFHALARPRAAWLMKPTAEKWVTWRSILKTQWDEMTANLPSPRSSARGIERDRMVRPA